jgi:PadR family transcriptional regulator, regulatory protein PadR
MRRKKGTLIPIEQSIIEAAMKLENEGFSEFHGFQIAKAIEGKTGVQNLTGYGTLYKALSRLQELGILESRWEVILVEENRPRRRYYHIDGEKAVQALRSSASITGDNLERIEKLNWGAVQV